MATKPKEIFKFDIKRDFGELIGAPFFFIRQEFKPYMLSLLKFAGPFIAAAVLGMALFSKDIYTAIQSDVFPKGSTWIYLGLFSFFLMFGFLAAIVTSHAYFTCYVKFGKDNFTIDDVGALLKKKVFTVFLTGILAYLMVVIGFLFLYIPGIYIAICMTYFPFIIVFEDTNVGTAITRSFKVANQKWWLTLGTMLVFGMIIGFSLYIFIIPIYIIVFASILGGSQIGTVSVILIILFVILYFVAYLFAIALQQVLVAGMYFNIVSNNVAQGLQDRINAINDEDKNIFTSVTKNTEPKGEDIQENRNIEKEDKTKEKDRFKENDENNRFSDDNNDRFKPKY
jgi:hypothetical protein